MIFCGGTTLIYARVLVVEVTGFHFIHANYSLLVLVIHGLNILSDWYLTNLFSIRGGGPLSNKDLRHREKLLIVSVSTAGLFACWYRLLASGKIVVEVS